MPKESPKFIIILVTCGSKREAERIAHLLLTKRLAACANIVSDLDSRFWWKGKIDKARESMIIIKSTVKNFKGIEKEIRRIHSYDVPEIIAIPIIEGSKEYLKWISSNVK